MIAAKYVGCSGYAFDLYSGGTQIEFCPGHRLY
jgi:hypothetical protein